MGLHGPVFAVEIMLHEARLEQQPIHRLRRTCMARHCCIMAGAMIAHKAHRAKDRQIEHTNRNHEERDERPTGFIHIIHETQS